MITKSVFLTSISLYIFQVIQPATLTNPDLSDGICICCATRNQTLPWSLTTPITLQGLEGVQSVYAVNPDEICVREGYMRDPEDCGSFYYCQPKGDEFRALKMVCQPGLYYDEDNNCCNYKQYVECHLDVTA